MRHFFRINVAGQGYVFYAGGARQGFRRQPLGQESREVPAGYLRAQQRLDEAFATRQLSFSVAMRHGEPGARPVVAYGNWLTAPDELGRPGVAFVHGVELESEADVYPCIAGVLTRLSSTATRELGRELRELAAGGAGAQEFMRRTAQALESARLGAAGAPPPGARPQIGAVRHDCAGAAPVAWLALAAQQAVAAPPWEVFDRVGEGGATETCVDPPRGTCVPASYLLLRADVRPPNGSVSRPAPVTPPRGPEPRVLPGPAPTSPRGADETAGRRRPAGRGLRAVLVVGALLVAGLASWLAAAAVARAQAAEKRADRAEKIAAAETGRATQAGATAASAEDRANGAVTRAARAEEEARKAAESAATALKQAEAAEKKAAAAEDRTKRAQDSATTAVARAGAAEKKAADAEERAKGAGTTAARAEEEARKAAESAATALKQAEAAEKKADAAEARAKQAQERAATAVARAEAWPLVHNLFTRLVRKEAAINELKDSGRQPMLSDAVRKEALALVEGHRQDPILLRRASWVVVRRPGEEAEEYAHALLEAEEACRLALAPDKGPCLTTLGVALCRVGAYPKAVEKLKEAEKLNAAETLYHLADLAFLAMAHHKLEQGEKAADYLGRLRKALKDTRWAGNVAARALLHEAEALLPPPAEPKKEEKPRS